MSIRRARMNGSAPLRTTLKRKIRIHIDHLRVLSWNADEVPAVVITVSHLLVKFTVRVRCANIRMSIPQKS